MLKGILLLLCLSPFSVSAQIITTVTGNGSYASSGDGGLAIDATLFPADVAFDKMGNLYIADGGNRIRKIDAATGIINTIAGNGIAGFSGDGDSATLAMIDHPQALVVDTFGNVYYSDLFQNRIRIISPDGIINTYAGNGIQGFSGDSGLAIAAMINNPLGITLDKFGNLYFTEGSQRIRKVSKTGIITTVVGNGNLGFGGDNGIATAAMVHNPHGIAVDDTGNLYIADSDNKRVRKVSTSGIITTIVGDGNNSYAGDGGPAVNAELYPWDVIIDKFGNLFISDQAGNAIRMVNASGTISTVAGNGIQGFAGDGHRADSAELNHPYGIDLDNCGNIYIADGSNARVRKVTYSKCNYLSVQNENAIQINPFLYPNPVNNILNIYNLKTQATYHIINIIGTVIEQDTLKEGNNSISVQSLSPGMYMLELVDKEGVRTITKIIKQ